MEGKFFIEVEQQTVFLDDNQTMDADGGFTGYAWQPSESQKKVADKVYTAIRELDLDDLQVALSEVDDARCIKRALGMAIENASEFNQRVSDKLVGALLNVPGIEVNMPHGSVQPLQVAIDRQRVKIVQQLLQHEEIENCQFLTQAVVRGNAKIVEALINDPRVDVNFGHWHEGNALMVADGAQDHCHSRNVGFINHDLPHTKLLLAHKDIDVNATVHQNTPDDKQSVWAGSALFHAIRSGFVEKARLLYEDGRSDVDKLWCVEKTHSGKEVMRSALDCLYRDLLGQSQDGNENIDYSACVNDEDGVMGGKIWGQDQWLEILLPMTALFLKHEADRIERQTKKISIPQCEALSEAANIPIEILKTYLLPHLRPFPLLSEGTIREIEWRAKRGCGSCCSLEVRDETKAYFTTILRMVNDFRDKYGPRHGPRGKLGAWHKKSWSKRVPPKKYVDKTKWEEHRLPPEPFFDEDWWMSDADDEIDEEETRDLGKLDSVKFNIFWTARY